MSDKLPRIPVALVAKPGDEEWTMVHDATNAHLHYQNQGYARVLITASKVYGPGPVRYTEEGAEEERREEQKRIDALADDFIATGRLPTSEYRNDWSRYAPDFELEKAVLREVSERLREAIADPFLRKVLEGG